jgi:hypothetical protein
MKNASRFFNPANEKINLKFSTTPLAGLGGDALQNKRTER